ncbi:Hypothetical protein GLP15_162 [Giardia lamblia P15]|uniref:Uncharacterized protein n=1 Tax=Giardia intestinalis (strain P15) TaxID=658858 RepID=E1EY46_GIAIA|nr:Hypothetical protein GLP15_162 [Giardia lamblia P15]
MVDIEVAIKSRYRLRLERMLAKCKKACINPNDYEFQIAIVNGQAIYTLIERRKQIVKTTVRDQVFKTPERKQYAKKPTARFEHPLLQTSLVEVNPLGHALSIDALSPHDLQCDFPREPSASGSRRRSSSVTYRMHLAEASESELMHEAVPYFRCNNPTFRLSPADSPLNGLISNEDDNIVQSFDVPGATLPSLRLKTVCSSKLPNATPIPSADEYDDISEEVEHFLGDQCSVSQSPTTFSQPSRPSKPTSPIKQSADPSAITIYKDRQHQFHVYGNDKSSSCYPQRVTASLSKVFPQAIFPPPGPYSPPVQTSLKRKVEGPGLKVIPMRL